MSCNPDFFFGRGFDRLGIAGRVEDWEGAGPRAGAGAGVGFVLLGLDETTESDRVVECSTACDKGVCKDEGVVTVFCVFLPFLVLVNKAALPRSTGMSSTWPHSLQDLLSTLIGDDPCFSFREDLDIVLVFERTRWSSPLPLKKYEPHSEQ